jgi:hypothetical protein
MISRLVFILCILQIRPLPDVMKLCLITFIMGPSLPTVDCILWATFLKCYQKLLTAEEHFTQCPCYKATLQLHSVFYEIYC